MEIDIRSLQNNSTLVAPVVSVENDFLLTVR